LNLSSALIVAVKSPEPGEWTLRVGAGGEASIRVTGLSPLAFSHGFSRAPGPVNQRHAQPRPITGQYNFGAPSGLIYGQLSTYVTKRYRNQLRAWRITSIVYRTMKKTNENLLKCAMLSTRILQLHASNPNHNSPFYRLTRGSISTCFGPAVPWNISRSTDVGVDSVSRFPYRAWTNRNTNTVEC